MCAVPNLQCLICYKTRPLKGLLAGASETSSKRDHGLRAVAPDAFFAIYSDAMRGT